MKYLSVCSGVEAATVAWHPLGWDPIGYAEIETFPSAVLSHHYPTVPNLGDITKYKEWNINGTVELLVGGTPCQAFSVAGLRKGLEDPRGNLTLVYTGILDRFKPKWFVWENVPGVLSSSGGRDFGSFLGAVAELGYGFSYRVLDAQYFGVPQRRRRVFVVGCLGDWVSASKVLFEPDCLSRDTEESRKSREKTAPTSQKRFDDNGIQRTVGTLCADTHPGAYSGQDAYSGRLIPCVYETHPADSRVREMGDVCQTVTSRWGTGGGNVPIALQDVSGRDKAQNGRGWNDEGVSYTLDAAATQGVAYSIREDAKAGNFSATPLTVTPALQALRPSVQSHHAQTFIAQAVDVYNQAIDGDVTATITRAVGGSNTSGPKIMQSMAVRRLTPVECERLQGFPDNYTNIPWRGKPESPDSLRYKAMGNSMAVPCMKWIGERIEMVEKGML